MAEFGCYDKLSNSTKTTSSFKSSRQQDGYDSSPCIYDESQSLYDSARPGTPALCDPGNLILPEENPGEYSSWYNGVEDFLVEPVTPEKNGYDRKRSHNGDVSRGIVAAHPSSPSQLYTLFLQRNRPPECPVREPRPQPYVPNPLEWNFFPRRGVLQNNEYRSCLRERDSFLQNRLPNNARPRFEENGFWERRPALNQNRLSYSMVRIKNTDDEVKTSNSMNGFSEDNEGNHECQDFHNTSSVEGQPTTPNGTLLTSSETREANDVTLGAIYQGEWPMHRALWMSGPSSIGEKDPLDGFGGGDDAESVMSFSSTTASMSGRRSHQLGTKVEMVYSLLSMLGSCNKEDMSRTLLEMSGNQDSCIAMRQSGCLPLLIQLLHGNDSTTDSGPRDVKWARRRASRALHNIVHAHPDDRRGRREARVLRLLEQIRDYSDFLRDSNNADFAHNENLDLHPGPAIAALMKLSFDEEHRHAMCQLGGLQAIAELIQADHEIHGNTSDQFCVTVRRYAGMALTNLTFGDGNNKALLCSMKPFMQALVVQLHSPNEDLRQVTASVLRNLSWRADASSKQILREVGVVTTLMQSAMAAKKESTLKSILSALWNLSAHCSINKADICQVKGALEFLVSTLTYKSTSSTLSIVENGGGILRNVSSHIAVNEEYRVILRKHKCLQTLLAHLKSPSLTIVSNACGTLWNLSARCPEDQKSLWEMGAVGMLRNLIHSKHKMISMGSSAALKNLLAARPEGMDSSLMSSSLTESSHQMNGSGGPGLSLNLPSLLVRKQRALAADLDENLSETCDNIDSPKTSPTPGSDFVKKFSYDTNGVDRRPHFLSYLPGRMYHSINGQVGSPIRVPRSESKDSLGSTRSEPPHYKAQRDRFKIFVNNRPDSRTVMEKSAEWKEKINLPYEGENNIVLQMFRHLQNGDHSPDIKTNGHSELSDGEDTVRPNAVLSSKRGSNNILNNRFSQRNVLTNSNINGHSPESLTTNGVQMRRRRDANNLLEIPGNKRVFISTQNELEREHLWRNGRDEPENMVEYSNPDGKTKVVLRQKKPADILISSVTTLGKDDDEDAEKTPLVISRCSSLSSLTSCFQHSARSSWVSDVSQRTSAIISPSDLPDSPGAYNTLEDHRHLEFTDRIPDADGIIRPRPSWPLSSESLPNSVKRMSLDSDVYNSSRTETLTESPTSVKTIPYSKDDVDSSQDTSSSPEENSMPQNHTSIGLSQNYSESYADHIKSLQSTLNSLVSSMAFSQRGSGIPVKSRSPIATSLTNQQRAPPSSTAICDDNDNLLVDAGSGSATRKDSSNSTDIAASEAFRSKCLDVCKKYPALSQKSSFDSSGLKVFGKSKTAIPQMVRLQNNSIPDIGQNSKILFTKSLNVPLRNSEKKVQDSSKTTGNSSSTEENISEDNILSSSPSACDESESDDRACWITEQGTDISNKPGEHLLRTNRVKSRKSKANRRSMEIRPPSEHSSEEENSRMGSYCRTGMIDLPVCRVLSMTSSESEGKLKNDEKAREKISSKGVIPDLLEGTAFQDGLDQESSQRSLSDRSIARSSHLHRNMTDSMELRRGALLIAAELEEGLEEFTNSSTSFDLENMKPPSCMGEMSMTSSGLSDLLSNGNGCYLKGKYAIDRRKNIKRTKKISNSHRFVLKSVRQTIAKTFDSSRRYENGDSQVSASTSIENISAKSSGTSDLIDNINPPSIFEDLSMTNSCASLNSISSDILESRSDNRSNSEMFHRLNAAAAMVQVYSREFSNMMTGSMKSSYNSECLDQVKPPSIFQDIAEVTVEDGTEMLSDPLVSDFELEEELPHDDEPSVPSAGTIYPALIPLLKQNGSLNSSVDGDSLMDKEHFPNKRISSLVLENQNTPGSSIHNDDDLSSGFYSNLTNDDRCSVGKDDDQNESNPPSCPTAVRRGPRIVKPINRETVRQMQEKKNAEKTVRGRGPISGQKSLLQQVTSARITSAKSSSTRPTVSGVRMTRTAALRASQNKQSNSLKTTVGGGRASPRSFLSKPPVPRNTNSRVVNKPATVSRSYATNSKPNEEVKKPGPLVKQNTFTKDDIKKPVEQNNNGRTSGKVASSPSSGETNFHSQKLSCSSANAELSSPSSSLQIKPNTSVSRKSGIPTSPSLQSFNTDNVFNKAAVAKRSPSSGNIGSRVGYKSTNSLPSVRRPQKEVQSKISSLWKKSGSSSSSANSPGTDTDKPFTSFRSRNATIRPNASVPPKPLSRSSTYEKLSHPPPPRQATKPPFTTSRPRPTTLTTRKPLHQQPPKVPNKPTGGARIVKPVAKPNAITSRTLRQSGAFYSTLESRVFSGPPSYISSGRSYGDNQASIPLVTAPFQISDDVKRGVSSTEVNQKNRTDSDDSELGEV